LGWIPPFLAKGKGAFAIRALYVLQFYTERFFFFASIFFFPSGSISPLLFRKNGSTTRAKIKEEEEERGEVGLFKNMGNFLFLFSRVL
jgi:hypothetical protein